jgi:hypothetical protein
MGVGIFFEGRKWLDGITLVEPGGIFALGGDGRRFVARSDRSFPVRYHTENVGTREAYVVKFVNARTDAEMAEFISSFGFPAATERESAENMLDAAKVRQRRAWCEGLLEDVGKPSCVNTVNEWFDSQSIKRELHLSPSLQFKDGQPALGMKASNFFSFMLMEILMLVAGGAEYRSCANNCGRGFLVGGMTGNTVRRDYCSNKCRVALHRKMKRGVMVAERVTP